MTKTKVLIVDDDRFARIYITDLLEKNGFDVRQAENGKEALDYVKKNHVDLIILDFAMPEMDGHETLTRFRAEKNTLNVPVILLSGGLSQENKLKSFRIGIEDFIYKSCPNDEFIERVNSVLRRTKSRVIKKPENILVTGGAGFIGSYLVRALLKKGYKVCVLDDFSTGRPGNLEEIKNNPDLSVITGSITDETLLARAVEKCDMVYHLAATVGVKNVVDKPLDTIIYDTIGTSLVLKYASSKGIKVLLTSTSEVYGKSAVYPFREDADLVIGQPDINRWSYACSKLLDEFFAIGYYKERALPVIVVRLFNTVGPRQVASYGMVIPRFFTSALKNEPIRVYGDGTQVRCFTYVEDVVEMLMRLAESDKANGEIVNIGGGAEISIKDLAEKIKRLTKSSSQVVFEPYEKYYGKSFQDIKKRVPDLTKLSSLIGSIPRTGLDTILEKMSDYYKNNPGEITTEKSAAGRK